ncbi:hypothetical protein ACW2QC_00970 [Virgibacillus sp. FSP13]
MIKRNYSWLFIALILLSTSFFPLQTVSASTDALTFGEEVSGNITEETPTKTYKFVIDQTGKIDLAVSSYMRSLNVEVVDEDGNKAIGKRVSGGDSNTPSKWSGIQYLEAGTYYVNVFDSFYHDTGNYKFTINYTNTKNTEVESNNGTVIAESLAFDQLVQGQLSFNDNQDVFKLTVPSTGKINIDLSSYMRSLELEVVDKDGKVAIDKRVHGGDSTTPKQWSGTQYLEAGTYYVKVYDDFYHDTGLYTVSVGFTDTNNTEMEPNSGTEIAQKLDFNKLIQGQLSFNDNQDVFKITVPSAGKIDIDFSSYMRSLELEVVDEDGKVAIDKRVHGGIVLPLKNGMEHNI